MLVFTNKLPLWQSLASGPPTKLLGCFYAGPKTYSLFPSSFLNDEAMTFTELCVLVNGLRWPVIRPWLPLLSLEGMRDQGGESGGDGSLDGRTLGGPCQLKEMTPGVTVFWFCYLKLLKWICYFSLLICPLLLAGFSWDPLSWFWFWTSPKKSEAGERKRDQQKRAMKGFLFSRKGNMPRDLVNIKPKGQVQEDETERKSVCVFISVHTHGCVCTRVCMHVQVCYVCFVGWVDYVSPTQF